MKLDERGLRARDAVGAQRAHREAIKTGREVRVSDRALVCGRAPIRVRAFELVLITQLLGVCDAEAEEVYLQIVLCGIEREFADLRATEFGERLFDSRDLETVNQDGRGDRRAFGLRVEPRETLERAKPERALTVAESSADKIS